MSSNVFFVQPTIQSPNVFNSLLCKKNLQIFTWKPTNVWIIFSLISTTNYFLSLGSLSIQQMVAALNVLYRSVLYPICACVCVSQTTFITEGWKMSMKLITCRVFLKSVVPWSRVCLRAVTVSSVVKLGPLHKESASVLHWGLLKISCQQKAHALSSYVWEGLSVL